jgi:RNA recognition motif-containing protein
MMEFVLGLTVGLLLFLLRDKVNVHINIKHTHIHKQDELSVGNLEPELDEEGNPKYNSSYGDPNVIAWFDQMHSRKGDDE